MQKPYIHLLVIFAILAVALVRLWLFQPSLFGANQNSIAVSSSGKFVAWEHEDTCLTLEVADTLSLRRQGLSGRKPLKENTGMLFLYDIPGEYGFWMKDMNFAIDIIWLNNEDEVVTIESRVSPRSYPHVFYPSTFAKKVIEISAGGADKLDLQVGEKLHLSEATSTIPVGCAMF